MIKRTLLFAVAAAMADTAYAQTQQPIVPFVVDVRAASVGLPAVEGWTPVVPLGAQVPNRSLGLEVGAHVYVVRFRRVAFGVGGTWLTGRGSVSPPVPESGSTPAPQTIPEVTTRLSSVVPQVSLNFGHSLGWSYLSAGLGQTRVQSEAVLATGTIVFTPRDSGWIKTLNFGGGARWFINDHLGVTLDMRWHKVSLVSPSGSFTGAPRVSLITVGGGIAIK